MGGAAVRPSTARSARHSGRGHFSYGHCIARVVERAQGGTAALCLRRKSFRLSFKGHIGSFSVRTQGGEAKMSDETTNEMPPVSEPAPMMPAAPKKAPARRKAPAKRAAPAKAKAKKSKKRKAAAMPARKKGAAKKKAGRKAAKKKAAGRPAKRKGGRKKTR
jgi:hypothetical protein